VQPLKKKQPAKKKPQAIQSQLPWEMTEEETEAISKQQVKGLVRRFA
jgi:hypothetical protein